MVEPTRELGVNMKFASITIAATAAALTLLSTNVMAKEWNVNLSSEPTAVEQNAVHQTQHQQQVKEKFNVGDDANMR